MSWNDANAKYRWCRRFSLVPVRRTNDFCGPDRRVLGSDRSRVRRRQKRLLWRVGTKRRGSRGVGSTAATIKPSHRLHELADACIVGRRIDRKAAELPIQANRAQAGRSYKGVARNIVDLERTAIDVAQHEIGRAGRVHRGDAGVLPL